VCMNCGLCAEFCPFDAIRMGHNYELAAGDRWTDLRFDLKKLSKPASYHAASHPLRDQPEAQERAGKKEEGAA